MPLPIIRRVITGHDTSGKAIVKIDETCSHYREGRPGANICNVWTTDSAPANNSGQSDDGKREGKFTTIENGSIFRIIEFKPGVEERVHRTNTIDYIVVMSGEIDMELESGNEVHLKAGDVMVQRGTVHNWINRGSESCVLAVILIHSKPVKVEGKALTAFG
jgi:quercetin dioxygenase-like cupin family protein